MYQLFLLEHALFMIPLIIFELQPGIFLLDTKDFVENGQSLLLIYALFLSLGHVLVHFLDELLKHEHSLLLFTKWMSNEPVFTALFQCLKPLHRIIISFYKQSASRMNCPQSIQIVEK